MPKLIRTCNKDTRLPKSRGSLSQGLLLGRVYFRLSEVALDLLDGDIHSIPVDDLLLYHLIFCEILKGGQEKFFPWRLLLCCPAVKVAGLQT